MLVQTVIYTFIRYVTVIKLKILFRYCIKRANIFANIDTESCHRTNYATSMLEESPRCSVSHLLKQE